MYVANGILLVFEVHEWLKLYTSFPLPIFSAINFKFYPNAYLSTNGINFCELVPLVCEWYPCMGNDQSNTLTLSPIMAETTEKMVNKLQGSFGLDLMTIKESNNIHMETK